MLAIRVLAVVAALAVLLRFALLHLLDMWFSHLVGIGEFLLLLLGLLGLLFFSFHFAASDSLVPLILILIAPGSAYVWVLQVRHRYRAEIAAKQLEKAVHWAADVEEAVKREPESGVVRLSLADAYLALGLMEQAFREFQSAASLLPGSGEVDRRLNRAELWRSQMLKDGVVFCAVCEHPNRKTKRGRYCRSCASELPRPGILPPGLSGEVIPIPSAGG